ADMGGAGYNPRGNVCGTWQECYWWPFWAGGRRVLSRQNQKRLLTVYGALFLRGKVGSLLFRDNCQSLRQWIPYGSSSGASASAPSPSPLCSIRNLDPIRSSCFSIQARPSAIWMSGAPTTPANPYFCCNLFVCT